MSTTITFDQIRERVAAHYQRPASLHPVMTAKGAAVLTVYRLRRLLADLDESERAEVAALVTDELEIVAGVAAIA